MSNIFFKPVLSAYFEKTDGQSGHLCGQLVHVRTKVSREAVAADTGTSRDAGTPGETLRR